MSAALPAPFDSEIKDLETMAKVSAASQVATAAGLHHSAISIRMAELLDRRGDIVARRAAGRDEVDDGPHLALIAADFESLDAMMPDAEARVRAARKALDSCKAEYAEEQRRRGIFESTAREIYEESHRRHAAMIKALLTPTAIKEFSI